MRNIILFFAFGAAVFCVNAQVKVANNGNMGVGITNPIHKLDVKGSVRLAVHGLGWDDICLDVNNQWVVPQLYCKSANFMVGTQAYPINTMYVNWFYYKNTYNFSDVRLKENIKPLVNTLDKLMKVEGKSYIYKKDAEPSIISDFEKMSEKEKFGFIAQDLEKVFPELVLAPNSVSEYYAIDYTGMIPILVEAIKEQQGAALLACCSNNKSQKSMQDFNLTDPTNEANNEELKVFQNAPNPFNESTIISCYIPESIKKAELCVYDMSGSRLQCIIVADRGMATVQIHAGQLASGVYTYLLIGDGKASDAKQMILTK